jgi:hypothetical protein
MHRATAALWVAACAGAVPLAWWALSHSGTPVPAGPRDIGATGPAPPAPDLAGPAIDLAAFNARLWNPPVVERPAQGAAPSPPPPPPPPPPPAGPLPVLLAIIREGPGDSRAAALYNPAEHTVVLAHEGDTILGRSVGRITDSGVELRSAAHVTHLALDPEEGGR